MAGMGRSIVALHHVQDHYDFFSQLSFAPGLTGAYKRRPKRQEPGPQILDDCRFGNENADFRLI